MQQPLNLDLKTLCLLGWHRLSSLPVPVPVPVRVAVMVLQSRLCQILPHLERKGPLSIVSTHIVHDHHDW